MSDPQPPEDLPARPPLPPQPVPAAEREPVSENVAGSASATEPSEPAYPNRSPAAGFTVLPTAALGGASTPPPNPFGQPSGRHAPPPAAPLRDANVPPEQPSGFAPPGSPGFRATGAPGYYAAPAYQTPDYQTPDYQAPGYPPPRYPENSQPDPAAAPVKPAARLATTGLFLGVVGMVGGIFFGWTLLLSIAAIVLGFLARSRQPQASGVALSAIITGFVGVVLSLGWLTYSILTWLALTAS